MSSRKKCVYLDEIRPWKWTWVIHVKVLQTWKPSFTGFGESLEIILADKKGLKIQATCKNNYIKTLGKECNVGDWMTIENFQVSPAGKNYRPTSNLHKITFINQTKIKSSDEENDDMFLALSSFGSILTGKMDSDFLIDILGQVIDVSELQTLNCGGKERKKIDFNLRDNNDQRIACCLWGKFAEVMDSHREESQFGVVVCLIRFAKIGSFRGNIQVSNAFDSSQLIIDPDIKEAEELKELFKLHVGSMSMVEVSEEGKQLAVPDTNKLDTWKHIEDKTISDLLCSTQIGKCKVVATIYAVDTDYAWYYFGCELCRHRTFKVLDPTIDASSSVNTKPFFWCEKCNQNVINVEPKFKIHLKIKDDTAETKLMLLDWIANPLLGVKAENILNGSLDELEDHEILPPCIIDIVGKTFKFGVDVVKDNITKGVAIYKVLKAWSIYNNLMVDSQSEAISDRVASTPSVDEGSLLTYSDESFGLVITPAKRSQDELGDLSDTTSTSKKRPVKSIKVEKMSKEELKLQTDN